MKRMIGGGCELDDVYYLDVDPRSGATALNSSISATQWHCRLSHPSLESVEIGGSIEDSDGLIKLGSRKRVQSESCGGSASKACREKKRRDMLNDRFLELASIMEPEKPPKMDKAAILSDAVRMVTQLRSEAQKMKESNENLQEKVKELKTEKNELRDEKQRLKAEKEQLEQQVKAMSVQPSFVPHPSAFAAQGQVPVNKAMPFIGYPGVAMWQFLPPTFVDTSEDHVRHPPVA
ncbi:transcription factor ILR3-like isoform X2 [Tasmannia lanceolata]